MNDEAKIRLGGMALPNGVLVHGPRHWACAVRAGDGSLELASGDKPLASVDVRSPFLRAPARVAETLVLLPVVRHELPSAQLPFQQKRVLAAVAGSLLAGRLLRGGRLSPLVQESLAALLALVPASLALRGTALAAYHGAEHIAIGSYEHDEQRPRQHERCGSHLLGPLLAATVAGNAVAARLARTDRGKAAARAVAGVGALAVAGETLGWMLRHPDHPVSRVLAWPGHELQSRFLTRDPTPDQLEVAEAALAECLRLEQEDAANTPSG
jgi:uncharacterized protein YqhQ